MSQRRGRALFNRVQETLSCVHLPDWLIGTDIDENRNCAYSKSIPIVLRVIETIPIKHQGSYFTIQVPKKVHQPFGLVPRFGRVDPPITVVPRILHEDLPAG